EGARLRVAYPYPPTMKTTSTGRALRYYQDVVYAWGPTLLLGLALPVAAVAVRRSRRRRVTAVAATLGAAGGILLLVPSLTVTQDYRYVLVAQALLWPAAALAASALVFRAPEVEAGSSDEVEAPAAGSSDASLRTV
ncbi:MAG TPA: hypothetical protein VKJ07_03760, partial [Mycobacteriales bacterium]|nr:hypothetical protein [Mycobacteriales bacterium]